MDESAEKLDGVTELLARQLKLKHPDHGEIDAFFSINWSEKDKAYIVACHSTEGPIFTSMVHEPTLMRKINTAMQEEAQRVMAEPTKMM